MAKIEWHGENVKRVINQALERNMRAACIHLQSAVKNLISTRAVIRRTRGQTGQRGRPVFESSRPGMPPHLRTGTLLGSIQYRVDRGPIGIVGTDRARILAGAKTVSPRTVRGYGAYLELGTRKMAARPYLRPALIRERDTLARILATPVE